MKREIKKLRNKLMNSPRNLLIICDECSFTSEQQLHINKIELQIADIEVKLKTVLDLSLIVQNPFSTSPPVPFVQTIYPSAPPIHNDFPNNPDYRSQPKIVKNNTPLCCSSESLEFKSQPTQTLGILYDNNSNSDIVSQQPVNNLSSPILPLMSKQINSSRRQSVQASKSVVPQLASSDTTNDLVIFGIFESTSPSSAQKLQHD